MDDLRSQIQSFLRFTVPELADPPVIHEVVRGDGFTRKTVSYAPIDCDTIHAFLFEPHGRPQASAAVVALHQHNSEWTLGKSEIAGLAGDPQQAFGPALARRGLAVLAPDALGFESRRGPAGHGANLAPQHAAHDGKEDDWLQYYNHAMHRLVRGDLLMTKHLEDVALAVTAIHRLTQADPVGLVGHSFGGNVALFAGALDTRISFVCASGAVCSFRHKLTHGTGLGMELVIPGFAARFDIDDLIRCIAPRKLFVVSSSEDPFAADAEEAVDRARSAFEAAGALEHLRHLRVDGAHDLDAERFSAIVEWLEAA